MKAAALAAYELAQTLDAARSLARQSGPPADTVQAEAERLRDNPTPLQGTTVAAMAFLEVARGDLPLARELFESFAWLDERAVTEDERRFVSEWLVCDAAAEGRWRRVRALLADDTQVRVVSNPSGEVELRQVRGAPTSSSLAMLDALAASVLGQVPANDDALGWAARAQLPAEVNRLVTEFLSTNPSLRASAPPDVGDDALAKALARVLTVPEGAHEAAVRGAAEQWEQALGSVAIRERLALRAGALGVTVDEALGALNALVGDALVDRLGEKRSPVLAPAVLEDAVVRRREALTDQLVTQAQRFDGLCLGDEEPNIADLWRTFVRFRGQYERLCEIGGVDGRALAYAASYDDVHWLAIYLRVTWQQPAFAHAVFAFLELESHRVSESHNRMLNEGGKFLCDVRRW